MARRGRKKASAAAMFEDVVVDPQVAEAERAKFTPPPTSPEEPSEDAQMSAAIPFPTPEEPSPSPSPVDLRPPTVADADRLWDWIRVDGPAVMEQYRADNSQALHKFLASMLALEQKGDAALRAIYEHGEHVGFGMIYPILRPFAVLHLYIAPGVRPGGVRIGRMALEAARSEWTDLTLVVMTANPRIARFAQRLGLSETVQLCMTPGGTHGA